MRCTTQVQEWALQDLLGCSELVKENLPLSGKVLALRAALADLPAQHICLSLASLYMTPALTRVLGWAS